ncbi:MAG: type II secretion system F family protein [Candidatus Omnitrophota bacterium]
MSKIHYKARNKFGKLVTGVIADQPKDTIAKNLEAMGYVPVEITEVKHDWFSWFPGLFNRVSSQERTHFTRQLATLQKAGIPIIQSFGALKKEITSEYFRSVIQLIITAIEEGNSLSSALAQHPAIFNDLYVNMVKAGEEAGNLNDMLERIAQLEEDEMIMRQRIQTATRYPMIVIGTLAAAFIVVVGFVLPKFSALFKGFKTALPLPTRILLGLSVFMRNYWILVLLAVVAAVIIFVRFINSARGRPVWDYFKLKVFIFGKLMLMITMSRFCRMTAVLLKSGLPILHILDLVKKTVGNVIVERAVDQIKASVLQGKGMGEPMRESKLFPPMVVQMVSIGEETGKIDELLMRAAEYYDTQVDYMLKNLTTLIEPLLIFSLGSIVLIMALAIFLPMWDMVQLFKR